MHCAAHRENRQNLLCMKFCASFPVAPKGRGNGTFYFLLCFCIAKKRLAAHIVCQKSLAEFAARRRQNKFNPFFAAACTSQKTLLSLQVWNLFAESVQIMRAADCKPFVLKGQSPFKTVSPLYTFGIQGRSVIRRPGSSAARRCAGCGSPPGGRRGRIRRPGTRGCPPGW